MIAQDQKHILVIYSKLGQVDKVIPLGYLTLDGNEVDQIDRMLSAQNRHMAILTVKDEQYIFSFQDIIRDISNTQP